MKYCRKVRLIHVPGAVSREGILGEKVSEVSGLDSDWP